MSTYTQILYQIVYSTKDREKALSSDNRHKLYEYIWGILKKKNCHPYRINGIEDHLHIATHIHPTVALSPLVKDIKLASSSFIKDYAIFKNFAAWQEGYAAFTYSFKEKDKLIEYIKDQENHHKKVGFKEELRNLLDEHGIVFNEKFLL